MRKFSLLLGVVLLSTLVVALVARPAAAPPPPNIRNYSTSGGTGNYTDQTSVVRTQDCPGGAGLQVLGGGAYSSNPAFVLVSSYPSGNGSYTAWTAEWRTIDGSPQSGLLGVHVTCAQVN